MMTAVTYLAAVVILEAWPVYLYLSSRMRDGANFGVGLGPLLLGVSGAALLTAVAIAVPLKVGGRQIQTADF